MEQTTSNLFKIYNLLLLDIKNILEEFNYLNLDEQTIRTLSYETIKGINCDLNKNFNSAKQEILKLFKLKIDTFVRESLLDKTKIIEVVSNYIKKNFSIYLTYQNCMKNINKLLHFFSKYNILLTPDNAFDILSNDSILNDNLKVIVDSNITVIKSGKLNTLFEDSNILLLIEIYCSNNNIEIKEEDIFSNIDLFLSDDIASDYIKYLRNIPVLSPEEERKLLFKIKSGDTKAKNKFIESNLRLVVSIAKKYHNNRISFMDIIQEGNIGLLKALDKFNLDKYCKFSTYATWWIRQVITRAIKCSSRNIRIPVYMEERINKFRAAKVELMKELCAEPTIEEIAQKLKISLEEVIRLNNLQEDTISLNSKINDEDETEFGYSIPSNEISPEEQAIKNIIPIELLKLMQLAKLTTRERNVLIMRNGLFGHEQMTLEKVGKCYHITRERVRQMENKIFEKLTRVKDKNLNGRISDENMEKTNLYDYLLGYAKEEIESAVETLSDEEKVLLYERFGMDFRRYRAQRKLSGKEKKLIDLKIIPTLKRKLKSDFENATGFNGQSQAVENVTHEDKAKISEQSKNQLEAISKDITIESDVEEEASVQSEVADKIMDSTNDSVKLSESNLELLKILELSMFKEIIKEFPINEAFIVSLKLGYINDKCYSTKSISDFLGISPIEVIEITEKVMRIFKERINESMDNITSVLNSDVKVFGPKKLV